MPDLGADGLRALAQRMFRVASSRIEDPKSKAKPLDVVGLM
jgi:hypothetical protein